jgi:VWFA-related protein
MKAMTHLRLRAPLFLLLLGSAAQNLEPQAPPPVFPREVELVSVDAVVVDKAGNPVTGLTRHDFDVLDEGSPQTILSFDAITLPAAKTTLKAGATEKRLARLATNATQENAAGRTFVVFFDSLNMSPLNAQRAKNVALAFLDRGGRSGDRVMVAAAGGGAWWTTRLPEGRDDLVRVLQGLNGRRIPDSAFDRMTDFEAMRVYVYRDAQVGRRVQERWERYGVRYQNETPVERERNAVSAPGVIDLYVDNRAAETYLRMRTRNRETLGALARVLRPLSATRDRKAVVMVSEGFIYDPSEDRFKEVVEAARRANAAVYFVDTRGLADTPSFYAAQFGSMVQERSLLSAIADTTQEAEGSASIARDTGGFTVSSSSDVESGIVRIGRESASYYVLGYNPGSVPRDGRFRKITVKLKRPGLTVRARRGYYAPSDAPAAEKDERHDPEIQAALDTPVTLDGIPLRLTAYVLQESSLDRARVLLAADADVSRVDFADSGGRLQGALDTLAVVAHRENSEFFRNDLKVDLERKPGPVVRPSWYTLVREFDLPAGVYQARLVVRDVASHRIGTVTHEFEVRPLDEFRLSTPVLSDAVQVPPGSSAPAPVLLARRTFGAERPLYCRFDVFGARSDPSTRMPRVTAGHVLRRADGTVVGRGEPTEVSPTSLGGLSRMMQIPLEGFAPGDYELVLTARDELAGTVTESIEPFELTTGPGH